MKEYPRILDVIQNHDWCITPGAYAAIIDALEHHKAEDMAARGTVQAADAVPVMIYGSVGVVDVAGIIGKKISMLESMCGGVDVNSILGRVQSLANDPAIRTIVMDWNSPGGTVTGVPEAYNALVRVASQKTLISYTETQMCSAAQWLASASTSIYAAASATVGSVGVYNLILDKSAALAQSGVRVDAISAGKHKLMGAPFAPLSTEQRAMLQSRVDSIHSDFKAAVTRNRSVDPAAMEGQGLTGKEGVKSGMIDGIYPTLGALLNRLGVTG